MNQIVPITSDPNQTLQSTLSVDGNNITLKFAVRYNEVSRLWVLTVTDGKTDSVLVDSMALVPNINLMQQFSYMQIGSAFLFNVSNTQDEYPTEDNLGSDFMLVWGDTL